MSQQLINCNGALTSTKSTRKGWGRGRLDRRERWKREESRKLGLRDKITLCTRSLTLYKRAGIWTPDNNLKMKYRKKKLSMLGKSHKAQGGSIYRYPLTGVINYHGCVHILCLLRSKHRFIQQLLKHDVPYLGGRKLNSWPRVNLFVNCFKLFLLQKIHHEHLKERHKMSSSYDCLCTEIGHSQGNELALFWFYNTEFTLYLMSNFLIAFAIAVVQSSRSLSSAAWNKYSTFSFVVNLNTPWRQQKGYNV